MFLSHASSESLGLSACTLILPEYGEEVNELVPELMVVAVATDKTSLVVRLRVVPPSEGGKKFSNPRD